MSEEDQILVVVAMGYLDHSPWSVCLVLGYQPDTLEFRYSRDEINIVYECLRHGWKTFAKDLYDTWTKDWVYYAEPERTMHKTRMYAKMDEVFRAEENSWQRELAAGKTIPSLVAAKKLDQERERTEFMEHQERRARRVAEKGAYVDPLSEDDDSFESDSEY